MNIVFSRLIPIRICMELFAFAVHCSDPQKEKVKEGGRDWRGRGRNRIGETLGTQLG